MRHGRRQSRESEPPYPVGQHKLQQRLPSALEADGANVVCRKPSLPDCMDDPLLGLSPVHSPVNSPALVGYVELLSTPELLGLNDGGRSQDSMPPPLCLPESALAEAAGLPGALDNRRASTRIPCPSPTPISAEEVAAQLMNSPTPEYKSHLGSFLPPGSEGFGNHYVELSSSKRSLSDVSGELD